MTICVKLLYEDVWGDLKRLLKYLKVTKHMRLIFRVYYLSIVKLWIYSSYNTHDDCGDRTVFMMIVVIGSVLILSLNQRLNVNISTEGGLSGAHNGLVVVLLIKYFIDIQIYMVDHNKLYIENKSTIIMEKNVIESSSKIKNHIKEQYLFTKDHIYKGDVEVEYLHTEKCGLMYQTSQIKERFLGSSWGDMVNMGI